MVNDKIEEEDNENDKDEFEGYLIYLRYYGWRVGNR